jgi:hypothetical protein
LNCGASSGSLSVIAASPARTASLPAGSIRMAQISSPSWLVDNPAAPRTWRLLRRPRPLPRNTGRVAYGLGCPQPIANLRVVVHLRATDGGGLNGYSDLVAVERREIRSFGLYRFYYAHESNPDGSSALSAIKGSAYARFYVNLADGASHGPWQ